MEEVQSADAAVARYRSRCLMAAAVAEGAEDRASAEAEATICAADMAVAAVE